MKMFTRQTYDLFIMNLHEFLIKKKLMVIVRSHPGEGRNMPNFLSFLVMEKIGFN